jgi:hypothetical protein
MRWRRLDTTAKATLIALIALVAGALALRLWLMLFYGPAFLGFGDSHEYVVSAAVGVFHDVQKPAGYPILLGVLHAFSDRLSFTILVQHVLGVATGLLVYAAVRRTGAPSWLGLIPAATVFFGGTGLLLEHSLFADPPVLLSAGSKRVHRDPRALGAPAALAAARGFRGWLLILGEDRRSLQRAGRSLRTAACRAGRGPAANAQLRRRGRCGGRADRRLRRGAGGRDGILGIRAPGCLEPVWAGRDVRRLFRIHAACGSTTRTTAPTRAHQAPFARSCSP